MGEDVPPNRGDRSFRAFLGVALWVISIGALVCAAVLFVMYLVRPPG